MSQRNADHRWSIDRENTAGSWSRWTMIAMAVVFVGVAAGFASGWIEVSSVEPQPLFKIIA